MDAGPVSSPTLPSPSPLPASTPASSGRPGATGIHRSVLLVAGAIGALVIAAVLIALLAPVQPASYPAGTPEAAFQAFYAAYEARDIETAYGLLSEEIRGDMSLAEYRRMDADYAWQRDEERRVVLLDVTVDGDEALLDVRVDQFSQGPLGGDRYSWERTVRLVREGGAWHVGEGLLGLETIYYFEGKY